MALNYTPAVWTDGETVDAAKMTAEVKDPFTELQAAWNAYVPVRTGASSNPTLGNGTLSGKYKQIGKTIFFEIHLTIGSTSTSGSGRWDFTLPVTDSNDNYHPIGTAAYRDLSANLSIPGVCLRISAGKVYMSDAAGAGVGSATITWATGDKVDFSGRYEAA